MMSEQMSPDMIVRTGLIQGRSMRRIRRDLRRRGCSDEEARRMIKQHRETVDIDMRRRHRKARIGGVVLMGLAALPVPLYLICGGHLGAASRGAFTGFGGALVLFLFGACLFVGGGRYK